MATDRRVDRFMIHIARPAPPLASPEKLDNRNVPLEQSRCRAGMRSRAAANVPESSVEPKKICRWQIRPGRECRACVAGFAIIVGLEEGTICAGACSLREIGLLRGTTGSG
jgi:hypothetical protein